MARGEPPNRTYTAKSRRERPSFTTRKPEKDRTYSSSSTPTFGPGGGGAAQARLQQDLDKILPAKGKRDTWSRAAEQLYGWLGEQETLDAVERGDISPGLGAAIITAGAVPLPGAKGVGKAAGAVAKGGKKVAEKAGLKQTVGEAVGEAGRKAANEAVGRKTPKKATGTAEVKVPKSKPPENPPNRDNYKHASSHSRAVSKWQQNVRAWNEANPNDKVVQATPDRLTEGRGKAATDTDRQMKKSESEKSDEEKAVVAQGDRAKSKAKRDEQKAAEQQETDVVGVDRSQVSDFVSRRRKQRRQATSVTTQGMEEGTGSGASVAFKDKKTGAGNERRIDDILATMRTQLRARDRSPGADDTIRVDSAGRLTPYQDPDRFTRPTALQDQRSEVQAARFESATGRKIPRTEDAVRRETKNQDPGIYKPDPNSPEGRLQARATAEEQAQKADDRTRNLMDGQRLSGEPGSNKRAPEYPKGPDYDPTSTADTAFDNYSRPRPSLRTTQAGAEQNVRIGRADGTVTDGTIGSTPEDLGPRIRPVIGNGKIPERRFETPPPGYGEQRDPPGTLVTGPDTPPSMYRDPRDYPPLPGSRRPSDPKPRQQREFDDVQFEDAPEVQPTKGKKGKKGKAQAEEPQGAAPTEQPKPQSGDNSPEAVRARNYERYRELERQGILNPGDADRIMSGGKGAKKVFDKTPTQKQRDAGIKSGRQTKKANKKEEREAEAEGKGIRGRLTRRNVLRGGGVALGTTAAVGFGGYLLRGDNDRPVVIPGQAFDSKNSVRPTSTSAKPEVKQGFLKDKYGRRITREEFQRREDFRQLRESLRGKVPDSALKEMRDKEMRRRQKFRSKFKKNSEFNVATRNIGGGGTQTRILDTDARKRISGVFRG